MEPIGSKAVVGMIKNAMRAAKPMPWLGMVANQFESNSEREVYPWGNSAPELQPWVGGRNAKGFTRDELTIENLHFEGSVVVEKKHMRRDKIGMIQAWVDDMAIRAAEHPESIISTLIENGTTGDCYDTKKFFATDHVTKKSGTQSNLLSVDISALPVSVAGIVTAPSVEEFQLSMLAGISQIIGYKDTEGVPKNKRARKFIVMVPHPLMMTAFQAVDTKTQVAASQTALSEMQRRFSIDIEVNPSLTWTDSFVVIRTDSSIKPFIFQRETQNNFKNLLENSEYAILNDKLFFGVDYWGNGAYGMWDQCCKVVMI